MTTVGQVGMERPLRVVELATNETRVVVDFQGSGTNMSTMKEPLFHRPLPWILLPGPLTNSGGSSDIDILD